MSRGETAGARPRWVCLALPALLAGAFALRLWYASPGLDNGRFFDERYSLENVSALLVDAGTTPSNAFYPSLSYLPQTAVLAASGALHRLTGVEWLAVRGDTADGFTPTAYLLCRLVAVVFGVAAVWVTWRLGRRLAGPRVGLLAAALFAATPASLATSAIFKPDGLVAFLTLVTFGWALDAAERPGARRFALAGAGVGLAVAAKYTGVGAAIPVIVAGLLGRGCSRGVGETGDGTAGGKGAGASPGFREVGGGWREPRRWRRLILAGAVSVAVFVLLNPHLGVVLRYIPRLMRIAATKGEYYGGSHLSVVGFEARYLFRHHGPVVLAFAVAGLTGLVRRIFVRRAEDDGGGEAEAIGPDRVAAATLLAYVLGYSALYAAAGKVFRGQNYLPVAALTSIAAAWAMVGLWRRLVARWPAAGRWAVAATVWAAAVAALVWPSISIAYSEVVPATPNQVEDLLAARLPDPAFRTVVYERGRWALQPRMGSISTACQVVDRLDGTDPAALDLADAEVFYGTRLEGPGAGFYLDRLAGRSGRALRFDPGFLAAWGPPLVAIVHPWRLAGEPEPLELTATEGAKRFRAPLARPLAAGDVVSLSIWVPAGKGRSRPGPAWVELAGERLELRATRTVRGRARCLTPRRRLAELVDELALGFPEGKELPLPWRPRPDLLRWLPPE